MYYFEVRGQFCKEALPPNGIKYASARRKTSRHQLPDLWCGDAAIPCAIRPGGTGAQPHGHGSELQMGGKKDKIL